MHKFADDIHQFFLRGYSISRVEDDTIDTRRMITVTIHVDAAPDQFQEVWDFIKSTYIGGMAVSNYTVATMKK